MGPGTKQYSINCSFIHYIFPSTLRAGGGGGEAKTKKVTDLLHFLIKDLLHSLAQALKFGLVLLHLLFLLFILRQLQTLFGDRNQGLAVKLLQLLDAVLVDGLRHVQDLETTFADAFDKG